MALEHRLKSLERKGKGKVVRLACPECRKLFTVPAVALYEYVVLAWAGEEKPIPALKPVLEHEHDMADMIEITGGRTVLEAGAPPVDPD